MRWDLLHDPQGVIVCSSRSERGGGAKREGEKEGGGRLKVESEQAELARPPCFPLLLTPEFDHKHLSVFW